MKCGLMVWTLVAAGSAIAAEPTRQDACLDLNLDAKLASPEGRAWLAQHRLEVLSVYDLQPWGYTVDLAPPTRWKCRGYALLQHPGGAPFPQVIYVTKVHGDIEVSLQDD